MSFPTSLIKLRKLGIDLFAPSTIRDTVILGSQQGQKWKPVFEFNYSDKYLNTFLV
jgi:hypothetical protein